MSNHLYGNRVRIKGIQHPSDQDLNGLSGVLRPKFFEERGFLVFGDIGVWLDTPIEGAYVVNIMMNEFEIL